MHRFISTRTGWLYSYDTVVVEINWLPPILKYSSHNHDLGFWCWLENSDVCFIIFPAFSDNHLVHQQFFLNFCVVSGLHQFYDWTDESWLYFHSAGPCSQCWFSSSSEEPISFYTIWMKWQCLWFVVIAVHLPFDASSTESNLIWPGVNIFLTETICWFSRTIFSKV